MGDVPLSRVIFGKKMDLLPLLKGGWEILWKGKLIWVFSLLQYLYYLHYFIPRSNPAWWSIISLMITPIVFYTLVIGEAGTYLVAYRTALGEPLTLVEAWKTAGKYFGRIFAVNSLFVLLIIPCVCTILFLSINISTHQFETPSYVWLLNNLVTIFVSFFSLVYSGIVIDHYGVRKSIWHGWLIFNYHFGSLALLAIVLLVSLWILITSAAIFALLVQSKFDFSALQAFNFINYSGLTTGVPFYRLLNALIYFVYTTYSAAVYTLVYLKYSSAQAN